MTYHLYGQDMDLTHHISCNYQQAAAYLEWWMSMELWLHSAPQIQWLPTTIHHFLGFFNISTWWYMSLVCRNGALAMYLCIHSIHISRGTSSSAACLFQCRFVILVGWKKLQSRWLFGLPYWDDHCVTKLIINPRCFEYLCLNFRQIHLHPSHKWIPRPEKWIPQDETQVSALRHRTVPPEHAWGFCKKKLIQKRNWKR